MALHVTPEVAPADALSDQIIELVGIRTAPLGGAAPAAATTEEPTILALQMQLIDNFVELIRMRTEIAERDVRINTLTEGIRTWRERVSVEQAERRRDAAEAREREREVISLLHQQMLVADSATAELERIRALPWWRRFRA